MTGMKISDMPVMGGAPAPPEPARKPKAVQPKGPADHPDSQQPKRSRRDRAAREVIMAIVVFFTLIAVLDAFAPHDYSKPAPASTITPGAVTGEPCGYASPVVSATAVNSSGPYTILRIQCADGVPMEVAR